MFEPEGVDAESRFPHAEAVSVAWCTGDIDGSDSGVACPNAQVVHTSKAGESEHM